MANWHRSQVHVGQSSAFFKLHGSHAGTKLVREFLPPIAFGTIWSFVVARRFPQ